MMDEDVLIEKIRECKTKERLFALMEEESNNDMKFWGENNYKAARGLLKRAMGDPETHYGPQHGYLSEEEMFEYDVEVFLSRAWEYGLNIKSMKEKAAFADAVLGNWDEVKKDLDEGKWDKYVTTDGPKGITAEETKVTLHKVYRIYSRGVYEGYSLVAADSVEEANKFIEDFRNSDPHNECDSYGYSDVSECDLEEKLFSTELGIILKGIY